MFRFNIRSVIACSVCIGVILAMGAMVTYVSISSRAAVMDIQTHNMATVNSGLVDTLKEFTSRWRAETLFLANSSSTQNYLSGSGPEGLKTLLTNTVNKADSIDQTLVYDLSGKVTMVLEAGGKLSSESVDLSDRSYVKETLAGKASALFMPFKSRITGNQVVVFAEPVLKDGKLVGGVALAVNVEKLLRQSIDGIKIGSRGYPYVVNGQGAIVFHPKRELMGRDLSDKPFIKASLASQEGAQPYNFEGNDKIQVWEKVPGTDWTVVTSAYDEELSDLANTQRFKLITAAFVAAALLITGIVMMVNKMVSEPVRGLMEYTDKISAGNFKASLEGTQRYEMAHLSKNIQAMVHEIKKQLGLAKGIQEGITTPLVVSTPDGKVGHVNRQMLELMERVGEPADYLNKPVGEFFYPNEPQHTTITGKSIATRAALQVETETLTMQGNKRQVRVDASPIFDLDGELIGAMALLQDFTAIKAGQAEIIAKSDAMAGAAAGIEEVVRVVTSASEELSAQIEQSSQGAQEQAHRVSETATAMEEMNATVLEVAKNASEAAATANNAKNKAEGGASIVKEVVQSITEVQKQALEMKDDMTALGRQAQGIGQILNVISDIADQTNLLALNAAIEAARAGDAGRGFAVVADEVRKLAEKTMTATKEVGDAIHGIQNGTQKNIANVDVTVKKIDSATTFAERSGDALGEIVNLVDLTTDQVRAIATAAEQQSSTSEEINRSIEDVSRISTETSDAMRQSTQAVSDLADQAQVLKSLVDAMHGRVEGRSVQAARAVTSAKGSMHPALPVGRSSYQARA